MDNAQVVKYDIMNGMCAGEDVSIKGQKYFHSFLLQWCSMLPRSRASIDQQILTRIPSACLRSQEQNCTLQFLGISNSPEERLFLELGDQCGLLLLQRPHHVRHHVAWGERVHADAVFGQLHGQGLDESANGRLRRRVGGNALGRGRNVRGDAGNEDDGAGDGNRSTGRVGGLDGGLVLFGHGVGAGLGHEKGAVELRHDIQHGPAMSQKG